MLVTPSQSEESNGISFFEESYHESTFSITQDHFELGLIVSALEML